MALSMKLQVAIQEIINLLEYELPDLEYIGESKERADAFANGLYNLKRAYEEEA